MTKKPMIVLSGPTAVGKTNLSIDLAKRIQGEIISADSMQVYRGMDIGTAKITKEEMDGIPHHLIDILNTDEPFNVEKKKEKARQAIDEIYNSKLIISSTLHGIILAEAYGIPAIMLDKIEK